MPGRVRGAHVREGGPIGEPVDVLAGRGEELAALKEASRVASVAPDLLTTRGRSGLPEPLAGS
jgi:hypothetical protein